MAQLEAGYSLIQIHRPEFDKNFDRLIKVRTISSIRIQRWTGLGDEAWYE
jgi:hypothetical protein